MLLAGIVLKLATYGFLELVLPLIAGPMSYYSHVVMSICTMSIVASSLSAVRQ